MSEPFLAEIRMFGFDFAPRGWAFCDGQLLSIAQNTALFSLVGTLYGGDGRTTFGLPDLRGRMAIHSGGSAGPGLTARKVGVKGGTEAEILSVNQMPGHNHAATSSLVGSSGNATRDDPANNVLANSEIYTTGTPARSMHTAAVQTSVANTGGGQAHNNLSPYLAVNFCIALTGIFPSRN